MIFEVMVIEKPSNKEVKEGKLEKIIHQPQIFVARDEKTAGMKAAQTLKIDLDNERIEVLCRPFRK